MSGSPDKLRLIVRRDLAVGLQAAQAVHVHDEFREEHTAAARKWREDSNTVALLTVPDLPALLKLQNKARMRGVRHSIFREPDLNDEPTALALEPGEDARRITSGLPLLGRG